MVASPNRLTALCATRLPRLLKADCTAMGMASTVICRSSFPWSRRSCRRIRIMGYLRNSSTAATTADKACASAVAQADPATPQRNTATNSTSRPILLRTETIRQYSAVWLSPNPRNALENK